MKDEPRKNTSEEIVSLTLMTTRNIHTFQSRGWSSGNSSPKWKDCYIDNPFIFQFDTHQYREKPQPKVFTLIKDTAGHWHVFEGEQKEFPAAFIFANRYVVQEINLP